MLKHPKFTQCILTCALFSLLFVSSCIKHPDAGPGLHNVKLSKFYAEHWYDGKPMYADSFNVTYNSKGDPIKVRGKFISTGYPQILISYDNQGRVKAILHAYDNGFYETANKYIYQPNSNVVIDSIFHFGAFNTSTLEILSTLGGDQLENRLTFDNQQRIVKIVQTPYLYTNDGSMIKTISYNNAGNANKISTTITSNLQGNSSKDEFPVYDNKVNFHRLHPVWQLIDWDYSKNNPFTATNYNNLGLPTEINFSYPAPTLSGEGLFRLPFEYMKLSYQ
ncbi:hypothetical protein DVR12_16570 [Chitinophaga silvatica]|uniref:YD repeat-containing protein n=1 Tax=Chitinophaga silvatica TaxID=2282649 RepID=A0A3E1Y7C3_9BACT|nr:hypothetical protein [Chitinophaga silvatica]RFS20965.1 hypothetical protein DVR12_16570 [Chitinophaga silvatica]